MNHRQQTARDRAVQVLGHYISVLFQKAGASASYTTDSDVEIAGIVDDIIVAATPASPAETAHAERLAERRESDSVGWGDKREKGER